MTDTSQEEPLPQTIELHRVELYGTTVDIHVEVGSHRDLRVRVIPGNEQACEVVITSDRLWFGLEAGRYLSADLEELEQQMGSKFLAAAELLRAIMQYGFSESALVVGEKIIETRCTIPVPAKPVVITRKHAWVLPTTRRKAQRKHYQYAPFA